MWVRLGLLAIERFAAKTDDTFILREGELTAISGGRRRDKAERMLNELQSVSSISCRTVGNSFEIRFGKLAKKQGFTRDNYKEPNTSEYRIQSTDGEAHRAIQFGQLKPTLSTKVVLKLIALRPHGVRYTEEEVQAWYLRKLPQMRFRNVKNTACAAGGWFARATRSEVDEAIRWVEVQSLDTVRKKDDRKKDDIEDFGAAFASTKKEKR